MIRKVTFGKPVDTRSVIIPVSPASTVTAGRLEKNGEGWRLLIDLDKRDIVYGLGESVGGINKRGFEYISWNIDDALMTEDRKSLYCAHNFILIHKDEPVGLFIDDPGRVRFDIGYTHPDQMVIEFNRDAIVYEILGVDTESIIQQFRKAVGKSYIPPKFGFGYAQSRWGYVTREDFIRVADGLQNNGIPVDAINMDIDYMQDFKDFTLHERWKDFAAFVKEMKERKIHLVPIIDAGIKKEDGYDIYEEGKANGYFCQKPDGSEFVGAAWPGYAVFADVLNDKARAWFGSKYSLLLDAGIDGFWNDMNEPALFYSKEGLDELKAFLRDYANDPDNKTHIFEVCRRVDAVKNSDQDFARFCHNINGRKVSHEQVHNIYGSFMTMAAGEAFERLIPDQRILLYSRSSYIGMHRLAGVWTGDNKSWWSHIPLILHQLPGLNMAGFLYVGCDLGGFGADTNEDLMARFLQVGMFTPLMRNHSALGCREQEPYQFDHMDDLKALIQARYRLIPFLYSEYLKAVQNNDLLFRPLALEFDDEISRQCEDQLFLGHSIMIAPVHEPNAAGRFVWLPERMMEVHLKPDQSVKTLVREQGIHFTSIPQNEAVFFIRDNQAIVLAETAPSVDDIDWDDLLVLGFENADYVLFNDEGIPSSKIQERIFSLSPEE